MAKYIYKDVDKFKLQLRLLYLNNINPINSRTAANAIN